MRTFLGTSLAFPLRSDGHGGLLLAVDELAVEDSIRATITTMRGSHRLEPWLGLPNFLFQPMPSVRAAAELIKEAILDAEDRVDPESLEVEVAVGDYGLSQVTVVYSIRGEATTRTLAQGYRQLT